MTTQTHNPLSITADSIKDMVAQSRERALEVREQITELSPEEIEQVGGGANLVLNYFPHGIIEPRLMNQFLNKTFEQQLGGIAMPRKF